MNVYRNIHKGETWKQSWCPSVGEWIIKMWARHTMDSNPRSEAGAQYSLGEVWKRSQGKRSHETTSARFRSGESPESGNLQGKWVSGCLGLGKGVRARELVATGFLFGVMTMFWNWLWRWGISANTKNHWIALSVGELTVHDMKLYSDKAVCLFFKKVFLKSAPGTETYVVRERTAWPVGSDS